MERGNGRSRALALAQNAPAAAAGCCRVSQRQVFPARAGLAGSTAACSERNERLRERIGEGATERGSQLSPRTHGRRPPDDRPMSPNGLGGTNIAQMERSSRATILRHAGHAVKQRDPYVALGPVRGSRSVLTRHRMGGVPDQRDPVTRRAWERDGRVRACGLSNASCVSRGRSDSGRVGMPRAGSNGGAVECRHHSSGVRLTYRSRTSWSADPPASTRPRGRRPTRSSSLDPPES